VVATRNAAYERGFAPQQKLRQPVVSIGNISAGGTGKTPFAIALGDLLKARGVAFDVLSRGYRRESKGVLAVSATSDPKMAGDEPVLIASRLGVPVVVAAERAEAGRFAEAKYASRLHLLDDGFQHRQLARQFDIVLLSAGDLEDSLLPVGLLREPLSSLHRADAVVIGGDLPRELLDVAVPGLRAQVWQVSRSLQLPDNMPFRPIVFCGIAKAENFFAQLRALGVNASQEVAFRDHYSYSAADIRRLQRTAQEYGADGFLTTEKDAVKLRMLPALENLQVARLSTQLRDADAAVEFMLATLEQRCTCE
jgi:tetraacyldisaccharide 4'-kinase